MPTNNEQTIYAIAIDSGFGSHMTLFRAFREKYGISPLYIQKMVVFSKVCF